LVTQEKEDLGVQTGTVIDLEKADGRHIATSSEELMKNNNPTRTRGRE
jgi:hypothetical protein